MPAVSPAVAALFVFFTACVAPQPEVTQPQAPVAAPSTRIAFLHLGPPVEWQGKTDGLLGTTIRAATFVQALALLEEDRPDIVVIDINCGGGSYYEAQRFADLWKTKFKPKFRTVAWVRTAACSATHAMWSLNEIYMRPDGYLGAATCAVGDMPIEARIDFDNRLSGDGNRDPKIMCAIDFCESLSCDVAPDGNVSWRQDVAGKLVVNPQNQCLGFTAQPALQCRLASAVTETRGELAASLCKGDFIIVGQDAAKLIDRDMEECDRAAKRIAELDAQYTLAINTASKHSKPGQRNVRNVELGVARASLRRLRPFRKDYTHILDARARTDAWFQEQDRLLTKLAEPLPTAAPK
ncbi:MAG: hypothetical protein ACREJO_03905 [Phycisphaerales bacterium]